MANQELINSIHKVRNILSEIYLRKSIKNEEITLMDLDKIKHELEKMWTTCLNCPYGNITGNREE